jgi:8-oxo-dGTP diphosphatase
MSDRPVATPRSPQAASGGPVVGVGGVVLADGPRVVLIRRKFPPRAGEWSLPGGRVERGEALAAAVAREIREETGLAVRVHELVDVVEIVREEAHYVVLDYLCTPEGGELCAGDDASEVAWVAPSALEDYAVTREVAAVVAKALEKYEQVRGPQTPLGADGVEIA